MTLEIKLLSVMYLISYFGAMIIQIRDKKVTVTWVDWILSFFINLIGAAMIFFMVKGWDNTGFRMSVIILGSLSTYRVYQFLLSEHSQQKISEGLGNWLIDVLKTLFTNQNRNKNE